MDRSQALRKLLDGMTSAATRSNEAWEAAADAAIAAVSGMPRQDLLTDLDTAVGDERERRKQAVYLLSALTDLPGTEDRIRAWLTSPDWSERHFLVQVIAQFELRRLAPLLGPMIVHEKDTFVQMEAIRAAGKLRDPVNTDALVQVFRKGRSDLRALLVFALDDLGHQIGHDFLPEILRTSGSIGDRTEAARRLGARGDEAALQFLAQVLCTPSAGPEQLRAAQALCEIHGWPFRWDSSEIKRTIARLGRTGLPAPGPDISTPTESGNPTAKTQHSKKKPTKKRSAKRKGASKKKKPAKPR